MVGVMTNEDDKLNESLLPKEKAIDEQEQAQEENRFATKLWIETKKLWLIVGPSIFSRIAAYSMNVVTQAFAGHLGEVQLAAISIANTVIVGFNFGLLVSTNTISSFLEWNFNLFSS